MRATWWSGTGQRWPLRWPAISTGSTGQGASCPGQARGRSGSCREFSSRWVKKTDPNAAVIASNFLSASNFLVGARGSLGGVVEPVAGELLADPDCFADVG